MQTISVKVDEDVYQELEKRRGTETKSVYYRKLIDAYLNMGVYQELVAKKENSERVYAELKTEYDKLLAVQEIQKTEIGKYQDLQKVYAELKTVYDKLSAEHGKMLAVQEVQIARIEEIERSSGFYIQEVEAWKRQAEKALYPSQEEQKAKPWWQFWKK